ncbi:hypothetical protein [Dichotomicrobium thermohalophilum]|uniref:Uncharacterized protein n=1 Tax=Dichotomicrobium thermohalophilum TaxID=933063 RepID=A0A397PFR1_9HYPH|nr:hypothetical protein [Dichotomicrobium thermohalophilum]RIA47798.1 hypothetical protein BXY53_2366 [Dichotomicrobium thermohalophilum]
MSADGFSALAVDDLGRSLMGWQLCGWQFEIPHAPLAVTFLEPGAAPVTPTDLAPIAGQVPNAVTESPGTDEIHARPIPGGSATIHASGAPPRVDTNEVPRGNLRMTDSDASGTPASEAKAAVDSPTAGPAPSGGGSGLSDSTQEGCEDVPDVFEFNVIFQLNVLLDSDFIVQEIVGASDASLLGLGFGQWAMTGGNTQTNTATIMDAGGYGDFGWLGGSYYETNAIYSLNALNDGDIAFNLISGGGLDSAQSITTGGNTQINAATVHSLTSSAGAVPAGLQIGASDTVDYNITTQINFMNDGDVVGQQIFGGGSGTQTASTGGNSQSNTALVIDDNAVPGHDVPGNYYEYNLIYQANYMNDGDQIAQIFDAGMADPHPPESGFAADDEALPHGLFGDAIV